MHIRVTHVCHSAHSQESKRWTAVSSMGRLPAAPPLNTTNTDCVPPGPVLVLVWRVRGEGVGPVDGTATHWPDTVQREEKFNGDAMSFDRCKGGDVAWHILEHDVKLPYSCVVKRMHLYFHRKEMST